MSDYNNDELWKEAALNSLNKINEAEDRLALMKKEEILPIIKERLKNGETQWDLLKRMIDGSMTERFIQIMSEMPDKDFSRNYLKLLEHFKPKVTRTDIVNSNSEEENTVKIVIVHTDETGKLVERNIAEEIEDIEHEEE